jgi:YCII-related domain.
MKHIFLYALLLIFSGKAFSQDSVILKSEHEMTTYVMGFLVKGPAWTQDKTPELVKLQQKHIAHIFSLIDSNKAAIAGPFLDNKEIRGIIVFKTDSIELARIWESDDPAVQAGRLSMQFTKWFAGKGIMKHPDTPVVFTKYCFGLLKKGPQWTPAETDEVKKIQEGQAANINAMAKTGKLVLVGQFIDGGDNRGVFIFKTESLDEAQALSNHDPAMQAGRLIVELHPWMVAKGSLP